MNPDAIRHYIRWLSRPWSPLPFYAAVAVSFGLMMSLMFRLGKANEPTVGEEIFGFLFALSLGAILAGVLYLGVRSGSWRSVALLETLSEQDHRRAWYLLMTDYRKLRPDIIDSLKFRRLMLRLCEQVVRYETLTDQQRQWMDELIELAEREPQTKGRSYLEAITPKSWARIFTIMMTTVLVLNFLRLVILWAGR